VDRSALPFFRPHHDLFGVGIDAVSPHCFRIGDAAAWTAGSEGMGLATTERSPPEEPYIFHFPDGNASIARLLVSRLVPALSTSWTTCDRRAHYGRSTKRGLGADRLNSTAVRVRHLASWNGERREVSYVRSGRLEVRGSNAVLACWNGVIPTSAPASAPQKRPSPTG
jgi:spermidine dehydrogenase